MRRIRSNYHNFHALKDAPHKLRKAIISNCDKDLVHSVSEKRIERTAGQCETSGCKKRKLSKFKRQLRAVVDKRLPIAGKKKLIIQRGGFLVHLLTAVLPSLATLIYDRLKGSWKKMLRKMYLVSPDNYYYYPDKKQPAPPTETATHDKKKRSVLGEKNNTPTTNG